MAKKPPALFRKKIKEQNLQKNFLRYIEKKDDRDFLASCFSLQNGFYNFTAEVNKTNSEKLKELEKAVKQNRKWPVAVLPLFAFSAAVAALIIFITIFMDPVLERAMENGLQNVFEAKVDVNNFHLNLFRFRISIASTTIADRDSPMKNLIDIGKIELRLNPLAVLRGKIYIEELRADTLRFGTPRETSGHLPQYDAKRAAREAAPKREAQPLIDLSKFDAMALIKQEYDNLKSVALYNDAINFYDTTRTKWEAEVAAVRNQVNEAQKAAAPFINFNINGIDPRNPESIMRAKQIIEDAQKLIETVKTSAEMAQNTVNNLQSDMTLARNMVKDAGTAATADLARLKSFVDLDSGVHREIIEPVIRDMLTSTAYNYINYGKRLLEALEKIKELQAKIPKSKKPAKETFKGRDVQFSSQKYPFFYLGIMASDFTLNDWNWSFDLRDVSSEPELTAKPVSLKFGANEESGAKRGVNFDGSADLRSSSNELFSAAVSGRRFPISVEGDFSSIGIDGVSGNIGFDINSTGKRDGSFTAGGGVFLEEPQIAGAAGTIAEAVAEAVSAIDAVNIALEYAHRIEGSDEFSLDTNIGALIIDALKRTAARYIEDALKKLDSAFRSYIADLTKGKLSDEQLNSILKLAQGDKNIAQNVLGNLESKTGEIKARIEGAVSGAVDQAKAEADRRAEEAKKKAEEEAKKKLEEEAKKRLPSLPFSR